MPSRAAMRPRKTRLPSGSGWRWRAILLLTEYVPGQTYAFTDLFFMVKGYDGYVFDTDSYDEGTTDETTGVDAMYTVCFACK